MFDLGGKLLNQTEDVVRRWKEHFEDLHNLVNMSSLESEDLGKDLFITLVKVATVVVQLPVVKGWGWITFALRC